MSSVLSLARPSILAMRPYESARSLATQGSLFLDANESPTGPEQGYPWNRYPEPQPKVLLERLSKIYGVSPECLLIGRGSDEAIDVLIRTFCESGRDGILVTPPTYGIYEVSAQIQGARVRNLPLKIPTADPNQDFSLDRESLLKAAATAKAESLKLIFLCSPNNPTGTVLPTEFMKELCEAATGNSLVVVDEAYAEFAENFSSMTREVSRFPNLVVLRTLSKAWAMAGVRCGVAIAQEPMIQLLRKVLAPYPLSGPAIQAILKGTEAEAQRQMGQRILEIRSQREWLAAELNRLPFVTRVFPSETNFVLAHFRNSSQVMSLLRARGIILRSRSNDPGLNGCIRITVGTQEQNRTLLSALTEVPYESD